MTAKDKHTRRTIAGITLVRIDEGRWQTEDGLYDVCRHQQHSRASLGDDAWRWSYLIELPAPVMGETFYWQVGGRTRTMDDAAKELAAHILKKLQAASEIIEPETEDNDTDVAETPAIAPVKALILPDEIAEQDKKLDADIASKTAELMALRWHWTLDESNPDRVSAAAYGRAVGRDRKAISRDATAWARWLADQNKRDHMVPPAPGDPQTPADYRQAAKLSDEREQVVRAVARANNKKFSNVAVNMRAEVNEALTLAQDRADVNGTTVAEEVVGAAESLAKEPIKANKDAILSEAGKKRWAWQKAKNVKASQWGPNGDNTKALRRAMQVLGPQFSAVGLSNDQLTDLSQQLNILAHQVKRRGIQIRTELAQRTDPSEERVAEMLAEFDEPDLDVMVEDEDVDLDAMVVAGAPG